MAALVFAFLAGLAQSALVGNMMELRSGLQARLGEPFVSHHNIGRSLLLVVLAGPYMLVTEAFALMHNSRRDYVLCTAAIVFAALWALACGILWLEFFFRLFQNW